jgi:multicomponent K+:H+ antiporter subunit D
VTLLAGVLGALASRNLQTTLGYLVIVSVGTLLAGLAFGSEAGLSAALYYLLHTTLVSGGLFLLADLVARQRGNVGGELIPGPALRQPLLLGVLFFIGAISVVGLPPFSGFFGKLMLLRAVPPGPSALMFWPVLLIGGLGMLIALSRSGSLLFWRGSGEPAGATADGVRLLATCGLLAGSVALVVFAQPIIGYLQATAAQLLELGPYLAIIRGAQA